MNEDPLVLYAIPWFPSAIRAIGLGKVKAALLITISLVCISFAIRFRYEAVSALLGSTVIHVGEFGRFIATISGMLCFRLHVLQISG